MCVFGSRFSTIQPKYCLAHFKILHPTLYYLNATAYYKNHTCKLKEFKKTKNFTLVKQHIEGACLDGAGWLSYKFASHQEVNICHFLLSS